jgi:hypothetical protein
MTDEQFEWFKQRFDELEKDIKEIKNNMLTKDEGMKIAETLELITTETAATTEAKAEDKAEATYTMMGSLIKGLENRLTDRLSRIEEQNKIIAESSIKVHQLVMNLAGKYAEQEKRISRLERKVSGED